MPLASILHTGGPHFSPAESHSPTAPCLHVCDFLHQQKDTAIVVVGGVALEASEVAQGDQWGQEFSVEKSPGSISGKRYFI